jgi:hypothetical protein
MLPRGHFNKLIYGFSPHWGCGGRRFKSCRPDHLQELFKSLTAIVSRAQSLCLAISYTATFP